MSQGTLTPRQQEIYSYLCDYVAGHGYPPTLREIGRHVGIVNLNAIAGHLDRMSRKGVIGRDPGTARGIRLVAAPAAERQEPASTDAA